MGLPLRSGPHRPDDELSSLSLVAQVGAGSERALAEAYERHAQRVFGLAKRVLGDADAAGEVVEQVFLDLWARPQAFGAQGGSLEAYLLSQTRQRSLDRRCSKGTPEEPLPQAAPASSSDHDSSPGSRMAEGGAAELLSDDERQVIELVYFDGLTCRELADLLGLTVPVVTRRIDRGLQRLRLDGEENPAFRPPRP